MKTAVKWLFGLYVEWLVAAFSAVIGFFVMAPLAAPGGFEGSEDFSPLVRLFVILFGLPLSSAVGVWLLKVCKYRLGWRDYGALLLGLVVTVFLMPRLPMTLAKLSQYWPPGKLAQLFPQNMAIFGLFFGWPAIQAPCSLVFIGYFGSVVRECHEDKRVTRKQFEVVFAAESRRVIRG